MLEQLLIKDFAVIRELNVDFKRGLNIITGETGAGKSVIIEAVSMALGSRADTSYIRHGSDKAVVTLLVDTDDCDLKDSLEEMGIPDDNPLIIRREINSQSRSICRINGCVVPLSFLASMCKKIADIHGQYDQQLLLNPDNHINILDLYGGEGIAEQKRAAARAYREFAELSSKLFRLKKEASEAERQKDFLRFEYNEIKDSGLKEGEDEELEESIRIMQNSEKLYMVLSQAYSDIFGSEGSADSVIGNAVGALEGIKGISKDIDAAAERITGAYYELDDINSELRSLRDGISFSEHELDQSIERIEQINRIKKKYGGSIESALEYMRQAESKLSKIENADEDIRLLEEQISMIKSEYDAHSKKLSDLRKETAKQLKLEIEKELAELNFVNARFDTDFGYCASSENGNDKVEFLISANTGEALKPLAKVASGGELSRIMLALKRVMGDLDGIPTMIFDEIDTGISGATAAVVGSKLVSISEKHQVICITHLPQIACRGENHFKIEKTSDLISTESTVVPLTREERVEEIARLLSGTEISEAARQQAKELLG